MTGPGGFQDLYGQYQQIFLLLLALVGGLVAAIKKFRKGRRNHDSEDEPVVRVPSDGLSRDHPDPVVRSLQRQLHLMDERLQRMAAIQAESDAHEEDNRRTIDLMIVAKRDQDDIVYVLRRIVRRLLDSWPPSSEQPHLTPHEWDVVGMDEDTTPRLNRGFGSESSA